MYDVVGIDMPCIDLATNVDKFPKPNGGTRVNDSSWQGGGKVSTGMVAAARLGAKCAMLGAVGDDKYGTFCIEDFKRHNIDVDGMLIRKDSTTSLSIVISDRETQGRSIVYRQGTACRAAFDELDIEKLKNTKYFFMTMLDETTIKAAGVARSSGAMVVIDADHYTPELTDVIPKVDVFIASEFVYDALFDNRNYEENCRKIMDKGPRIVVFTFGGNGCAGLSSEGFFQLPAFDIDAVDTVGAGDVFHGAFIAGLLSSRNVKETARFSSAVSAIKCTRIGGRAGIPDMNTVEKFLSTGEIDYKEINKRVEFYRRGLDHV